MGSFGFSKIYKSMYNKLVVLLLFDFTFEDPVLTKMLVFLLEVDSFQIPKVDVDTMHNSRCNIISVWFMCRSNQ